MTQVPAIIVALGAVLFLMALLGGGISLKEISLPAITPRLRVALLPISIILMALGIWLSLGSPIPAAAPQLPSSENSQPSATLPLQTSSRPTTAEETPVVDYRSSGTLIYQEDFEDGYAVGWDTQWEPSMTVVRLSDGNHVLVAGNSEPVLTLHEGVFDYTIEARLMKHSGAKGAAGLVVRWTPGTPGASRYYAYMDFPGGWLNLVESDFSGDEVPAPQGLGIHVQIPFSWDTWYTLAVEASGTTISVYLDDQLVGTGQDNTLRSNRVGIWSFDGGSGPQEVYVDDVRVWSLP